ncbi:DoxX family protein [Sphingopyxis sp. 113P3]|jgi:hypothetical protein|uniref:DoxX family protein n=1 Tax=Sphingopyxis sp. (strain 113P3) TaxID=292913 RepID=UPI0006BC885F|nr:DoxX family protein [Sphingopyxis sp. 113P3]ALC10359.1 membrane protein [Sphingopyxis sp. 113P3]
MTLNSLPSRRALIAGRILSGLVVAFLLLDCGTKLIAPQVAIDYSPPGLGWRLDVATMRTLGLLLLIPTLLHIWPRTAMIGAILITGYLGGAIATHLRIDSPLASHTLFGAYLGILLWGGLWLRSPALRRLIPVQTAAD